MRGIGENEEGVFWEFVRGFWIFRCSLDETGENKEGSWERQWSGEERKRREIFLFGILLFGVGRFTWKHLSFVTSTNSHLPFSYKLHFLS